MHSRAKTIVTGIPDFTLRFAADGDEDLITEYIRKIGEFENLLSMVEATPERVRKTIVEDKRAEVLIAQATGVPAGFALFYHNYSTYTAKPGLFLEDMYIDPEYRGRGFGKEIFRILIGIAKLRGCGRMEWSCLDRNERAMRFYDSLGAKKMDEWTTYRLFL